MSEKQGYSVYQVRPRRRLWRVVALATIIVIGGLAGCGAWLARAESNSVPPNIEIGGVDVGGLSLDEARSKLDQKIAAVAAQPIEIVAGDVQMTTSGAEIGATGSIDSALEEAQASRGSLSRLGARLGIAEPVEIPLTYSVDPERLDKLIAKVARKVERDPVSAGVELVGDEVVITPSQAGVELDPGNAEQMLASLPASVELATHGIPPEIDDEAAAAAKAKADTLITDAPAVAFKKTTFELPPDLVRNAIVFKPAGDAIAVTLAPKVLEEPLTRAFAKLESPPRDATFRVQGKRVRVVPSKPGRELAVKRTAVALVAGAGSAKVKAVFDPVEADLTTAEAKDYRIRELVSEFTTPYPCCAPRVNNIQRAAAILDGYVIAPGKRFSLNQAMGERTPERGFVLAPMIQAGRLIDSVGGGVSQVATTFYNAAFFAGLELIAHTPHQFYISRYPMGREATVSWGGPELIFRNDWPAAILVKVSAGDTSITVRFYSSKLGRRVQTVTSDPYAYTAAQTIREFNPSLPPGSESVIQSGGVSGFSVDYTRKVYRGDKLRRNEKFHVRYDPEDTIIEYGPTPSSGGSKGSGGGTGQAGAGQGGGGGGQPQEQSGSSEPPTPPN